MVVPEICCHYINTSLTTIPLNIRVKKVYEQILTVVEWMGLSYLQRNLEVNMDAPFCFALIKEKEWAKGWAKG